MIRKIHLKLSKSVTYRLLFQIYIFLVLFYFYQNAFSQSLQFRNIGPTRGGRVTAVCGVDNHPNTFYMGASGGGLWKSNDYGIHWKNISDRYFKSPSIGAIAVYQPNPDIIYVGTGSDAIRSNVIVGKGIYKSIDAGKTWKSIGLENAGQIGAIKIHPNNPNLVYAAVVGQPFRKSKERGIYKTKDGGITWEQILFQADSVGGLDVEFAPNNPAIMYATMWRAERKPWTIISGGATDGIFKSTDSGNTWKRLTKGLPNALFGKADLAVSKAKPSRVWAQIQASDGQEGIYKSDDYGESWTKITMPERVHKSVMYRPFYFTNIDVNPQNADNIWAGTKQLWTSYDGGKSWKEIIPPHADHHDLWINPQDSLLMICGNDGGGAISRDGGKNWSLQFNQPTAELYTCDTDNQYPYYLYAGQQDNSTIRVPSQRPRLNTLGSNDNHGLSDMMFWENVGGCETGPAIPKPDEPHIIYANCKGQFSVYDRLTGQEQVYYVGAESLYGNHPDDITYRFQRVTPVEVSPHDPNTVYYGSQFLHKTNNGGKSWKTISPDLTANQTKYRVRSGGPIDEDISGEEYYAVLYAIQESPVQQGVIWTGSNDGVFYISKDGGKSWKNVTPDMPSGGRVSNIDASPHQAGKAYFAVYRDYLGDDQAYFYKTEDFGQTWACISNAGSGIPQDHAARVIREDPHREGLLYAGTEFGLFISFDDGKSWSSFQKNLPIVPITDLQIIQKDLAISTLGRSFWILDDISPLHQYKPDNQELTLYKPKDIIGNSIQYIYFQLPEHQKDTSITFTFSKNQKIMHTKQESLLELANDDWGIRKTEWDLRHYLKTGDKDFQGPKVSPGRYTIRMTYAGQTLETDFEVLIHPKLQNQGLTQENLQEQENLAVQVAKLLIDIKQEIKSIETAIKQTKNSSKKTALQKKLHLLKKGSKRYDQPKLYEHTQYLYKMISKTPQKLGEDAFQRFESLQALWARYH